MDTEARCKAVGPWGRCVYPEGHTGSHGICTTGTTAPGAKVLCLSLREWLEKLVNHGGKYVRADDPTDCKLGMLDTETNTLFLLPLVCACDRTSWGMEFPDRLLKTQKDRDRLARMLTTGDHCLEFPE